jgi:selenocysteine lyase/cysteine desulfurase
VGKAIEFYEMIGAQRKEQRLFYLKNYWMNKVKDLPGIRFGTSQKPGFGCGIGLVDLPNKKPAELELFLMNTYRVHTSAIVHGNFRGIRVTPNVYTTTKQLDVLAEGMVAYAKRPA